MKTQLKLNIMNVDETTQVSKVAIIKLDKDYNRGLRAWVIQESYDGKIDNPHRHFVMKREYFDKLQDKIMNYLSEGFKVEIENL